MATQETEKKNQMRGYRTPRCPDCRVPAVTCICSFRKDIPTSARFWILMHPDELKKPTNTGQLMTDCLPNATIFIWDRLIFPENLINLLRDKKYDPYLIFPDDRPDCQVRVKEFAMDKDKIPAFLILDGTWKQARKMLRKSEVLQDLPVLPVKTKVKSEYLLRRAADKGMLCTAEVAIELLKLNEEAAAAEALHAYFKIFNIHYDFGKRNHPMKTSSPFLTFVRHSPSPFEGEGDV
jgi:DTW domain-containing protein YfiP